MTFSTDVAPLVQSASCPAFVDVEPDTYQIDVDRIEEMIGPRTKAILAPEPRRQLSRLGPHPRDRRRARTARRRGHLRRAGFVAARHPHRRRAADIVVTSFARTPLDDRRRQRRAWSPSTTTSGTTRRLVRRRWGRRSETYLFGSRKGSDDRFGPLTDGTPYDLIFVFDDMGYNFEPSEIMAAYGLVQMDKLPEFNAPPPGTTRRCSTTRWRATRTRSCGRARTDGVDTTWMRYPFLLDDGIDRTEVQEFFDRAQRRRPAWCGPATSCASRASPTSRTARPPAAFPNADRVMDRALSLPIHHGLTSDDVGHLVESLNDWLASM